MTIWELYQTIFDLRSDEITLVGVKRTGGGVNRADDKTYRFTAIVSAPAPQGLGTLRMSAQTEVSLINRARRLLKKDSGPDLVFPVKWEIVTKDGEKKKKTFNFASSMTPLTVFGFEVFDGRFYIKVEMYGLFY
jgi:hypothetical protein